MALILASFRHAIREVLGDAASDSYSDEVLLTGVGLPLRVQMERYDAARADLLYDSFRTWSLANTARLLAPVAGIDTILEALHDAGGRLGIVTSKLRDAVDLALACQPLPVAFEAIVALGDTDRHKPGPEPVRAALALIGATPEEAVYVGDAPHDLQAGRAAGTATIGVTWGASTAATLALEEPDAIASTPAELGAILFGAVVTR